MMCYYLNVQFQGQGVILVHKLKYNVLVLKAACPQPTPLAACLVKRPRGYAVLKLALSVSYR